MLKHKRFFSEPEKTADIYSFSFILFEIFTNPNPVRNSYDISQVINNTGKIFKTN